jgi:hypothetical protein
MTAIIFDLTAEREKRGLSAPKPVPVLDEDWDDDVPVFDRALLWGVKEPRIENPLTVFFSRRDPGDGNDS